MANTNISKPCCLNVGTQVLSGGILQPSASDEPELSNMQLRPDGSYQLRPDGDKKERP